MAGKVMACTIPMKHTTTLIWQRLVKESAHQLGHVLGLRHCLDWRCVMASTHDVERLDLKGEEACLAAVSEM